MVDTRFKASKWRDRGKCRAVEDLLVELDNSPALSSGDNSMDCSPVSQFVTAEQLGRCSSKFKRQLSRACVKRLKH